MSFRDFQTDHHGGHLGSCKWTNLAILNLHITPMPPTTLGLNPTCCLGADVVWRFSRWPQWWPSLILEQNSFSNSESLCCSNASHQVSAQCYLQFGQGMVGMSFKDFQDGRHGGHLQYQNTMILSILSLQWPQCLPPRLVSIWLWIREQMWFQVFQVAIYFGETNETILAILNLYVAPMPPIKFWLNLTYGLRGDVISRISRWPPRR